MRLGLGNQTADFRIGGLAGGGAVAVGAAVGVALWRAPAAWVCELNVVFGRGVGWQCWRGLAGDAVRGGMTQGAKLARDAAQGAGETRGGAMGAGEGDIGRQECRVDGGGEAGEEADVVYQERGGAVFEAGGHDRKVSCPRNNVKSLPPMPPSPALPVLPPLRRGRHKTKGGPCGAAFLQTLGGCSGRLA